ncbi:tetraspanin-18-like [Ptychodera flava]|uniref:tetraspanin-18-like n=1 Tax=Ptychodera flava TaxID=63121 RepID=UPI00396A215B
MATTTCGTCSKILLFFFNFIFWLSGLVVLIIGVWVTVDRVSLPFLQIMDSPIFKTAGFVMIGVGGFVTLLGFFGCAGAWCENKCMLWTYFLLVFIILLAEIVCTILLFVFKSEVESFLKTKLNETMSEDYGKSDQELYTQAIDAIQITFDCCGTNYYTDWKNTNWYEMHKNTSKEFPQSCCLIRGKDKIIKRGEIPEPVNATVCFNGNYPNQFMSSEGCYPKIYRQFNNNIWIIGGVGMGIAVLQLLGIVFAICLLRNLKDYDFDD